MRLSLFFLSLLPFLCAQTVHAGIHLSVRTEGKATGLKTREVMKLGKNSKLKLDSTEPHLIELDDRLPVVLVPYGNSSAIELDPPAVDTAFKKRAQEEGSAMLSALMNDVNRIQRMIHRKRFEEANESLERLKERYPNVRFLDFISGSILAMRGDRQGAIEATERALEAHPDYEEGRSFLKQLKGEH
jgi:tetratricopeptide (TPR) repeat protein